MQSARCDLRPLIAVVAAANSRPDVVLLDVRRRVEGLRGRPNQREAMGKAVVTLPRFRRTPGWSSHGPDSALTGVSYPMGEWRRSHRFIAALLVIIAGALLLHESLTTPKAMSGDRSKTGEDRKLIGLTEPYEVRDWCKSLGCTKEELQVAVKSVGNSADKVREYLKRNA